MFPRLTQLIRYVRFGSSGSPVSYTCHRASDEIPVAWPGPVNGSTISLRVDRRLKGCFGDRAFVLRTHLLNLLIIGAVLFTGFRVGAAFCRTRVRSGSRTRADATCHRIRFTHFCSLARPAARAGNSYQPPTHGGYRSGLNAMQHEAGPGSQVAPQAQALAAWNIDDTGTAWRCIESVRRPMAALNG